MWRIFSVAVRICAGGNKKTPLVPFSRCLIKDFEARPSVTHLLEHPFIKQAHGKEVALRQQLAALIREQQQEASCRTKTRYIFPSNCQEMTVCGATREECCIRGATASVLVLFFFLLFVQQGAGYPALQLRRGAECETSVNGQCKRVIKRRLEECD